MLSHSRVSQVIPVIPHESFLLHWESTRWRQLHTVNLSAEGITRGSQSWSLHTLDADGMSIHVHPSQFLQRVSYQYSQTMSNPDSPSRICCWFVVCFGCLRCKCRVTSKSSHTGGAQRQSSAICVLRSLFFQDPATRLISETLGRDPKGEVICTALFSFAFTVHTCHRSMMSNIVDLWPVSKFLKRDQQDTIHIPLRVRPGLVPTWSQFIRLP